jgi:putative N-acetylmannosamine-6-phosphate epimerase
LLTYGLKALGIFEQESYIMPISRQLTLLDVIQAVHEEAANDQETLVTVVHLITSGQVGLRNDTIKAMKALLERTDTAA